MIDYFASIGLVVCSGALALFSVWFMLAVLEWLFFKFFYDDEE